MRILCPKCGRPGSLRAYSKGPSRSHQYYRIEHDRDGLKPRHHYLPFDKALALLAAEPPHARTQTLLHAERAPTG